MSEVVSALGHASFEGFAKVSEIGPLGMITLRAKPDVAGLAAAVAEALEVGYTKFTRESVATRAGVSPGRSSGLRSESRR